MMTPCKLEINANTKEEANRIASALISKKLMAGCLVFKAPTIYWWEGKIVEKDYWHIRGFSVLEKKHEVISTVESMHSDQCPVIAIVKIDGNKKFLDWIKEYTR